MIYSESGINTILVLQTFHATAPNRSFRSLPPCLNSLPFTYVFLLIFTLNAIYYSCCSDADRPTDFSCQTGQGKYRIYLPRLKSGCSHKCM